VSSTWQRLKHRCMDSALSGQRRVLEKFFPSSPRQDPIYVKPTIFVVIGLGLVVPILLSAPYLHTLWFCNVGLQRFSSEGREIAKYWCDWVVLICQFSLFLIVGGVVVTEQFTDQIRTRIQNSEETFDRLLSQLVQRAQPVKTNSVFRLAARRTGLGWPALEPEAAPVSEKRVGLNRSPGPAYGR
jgi:hypothetical protein